MNWFKLIISLIIPQLAAIIGGLFTAKSIPTWYATLIKPSFNPPNWLFGPVWTTLYLLMGISLYLVWNSQKDFKVALIIFGIQLGLNLLWSILFFGLHQPLWAFIEIIFLWIFIVLNIIFFYKISPVAGLIQIPYLLWVSFAALLNFFLWRLNL